MIDFDRFVLDNGLRCLVHRDESTPLVAVNVMYDVGSKDEDPERTGFAHLFEHLMFGGSVNIPNYDEPLEKVGGDNNAFTSTDITNYYLTIPRSNLETAFWLESDRMLSLAFTPKSLEVQRNVVTEEFKQMYLNRPYGDAMLALRPLAYKKHPYQWPTIGKKVEHIAGASLEEVKAFFQKHYTPQNAVLSVAGNITTDEVRELASKWFGPIPAGNRYERQLPKEPAQQQPRQETLKGEVPFDAIYKAYHTYSREKQGYYAVDLISDILSQGDSSRLYNRLVKEEKLFTDIDAYITGELEEGLFLVEGKLRPGVSMEDAEDGIRRELDRLKKEKVGQEEFDKVKNKIETLVTLSEMKALHKGMNLAFAEIRGDASKANEEVEHYRQLERENILEAAQEVLVEENCSTLYYLKN